MAAESVEVQKCIFATRRSDALDALERLGRAS